MPYSSIPALTSSIPLFLRYADNDLLGFIIHAGRDTDKGRRRGLDDFVVPRRVPIIAQLGEKSSVIALVTVFTRATLAFHRRQ